MITSTLTSTSTTSCCYVCYVLTAVGSLSNATIRMSSAPKISNNNDGYKTTKDNFQQHIRTWDEILEIVSLVGTFGLQSLLCDTTTTVSTVSTSICNPNSSKSANQLVSKHLHIIVLLYLIEWYRLWWTFN
jgi:hypothetical protein